MPFVGDTTQGASSNPGNGDRCLVTLFTAAEAGTIVGAQAYFAASSSSGSSAKVVMYTNSSGVPGTLVAASSGTAVPAGGGLVTFTMSGSFSAADYFIGVVYSDFQANVSTDDGLSGMNTDMANGTLSYSSPPASWPGTDIEYTTSRVNAAVEYTTAGGGGAAKANKIFLLGVG